MRLTKSYLILKSRSSTILPAYKKKLKLLRPALQIVTIDHIKNKDMKSHRGSFIARQNIDNI